MKIRLVGGSGLRSSSVVLGSMTFGEQRSWGASEEESQAILQAYFDRGGTTIDTAPNYSGGKSEEIIGRFAKCRRDQLVLSTKYTASSSAHPLAGGNSRRSMIQSVETSLTRMGTDRIDLLWLHFWDFTTPLDEILRAADDLVRAGKILYFGLSDTPAWIASRAATMSEMARGVPITALQLEYNAASRSVENDLLPLADACEMGVFCWGPLAAGALANGDDPQRRRPDTLPPEVAAVAQKLVNLGKEAGRSTQHLALRWLVQSRQATCFPIVGARTATQIANTLDGLGEPLGDEIMEAITAMAKAPESFPRGLINSPYLRKFSLGQPDRLFPPAIARR